MLFLNTLLLFGLLTVSIPIIIHLLHRRSEKKVDWGAMLFLLDSLVRRRRRILIEEILLLGTRCLLLALLALALARPFITAGSQVPWVIVLPMLLLSIAAFGASVALWRYPKWRRGVFLTAVAFLLAAGASVMLERWLNLQRFGAGLERDVVLVIDGSSSMTMGSDGISNFERALEEAETIIKNAGRQTAFGVILGCDVPSARMPTPVTDRRDLIGVLDELRPIGGAMRALDSLALAAVVLAQGYNPSKQIVVITDGQDMGWETESPVRWQFLADTFANLPSAPQIIIRRLGLAPSLRNLAVAEVAVSREVIGTDRPVTINVIIENTGNESATPSDVRLEIDGTSLTDNTVDQLEPGESETVKFSHHFKKAGSHVVTARVTIGDDLADDDTRSIVLNAVEKLPVLIVDGNPAARFLERAASFTQLALSPKEEAVEAGVAPGLQQRIRFLVEPDVVNAPDIVDISDFAKYRVVILADVPRLPQDAAQRIEQFTEGGGGVLIAPGRRAEPRFYNQWQTKNGGFFSPARMVSQEWQEEDGRVFSPSISTFTHPALRLIADASQSDIGTLSLSSYWKLQEDAMDTTAGVGGRLNTGDPILVEKQVGDGLVLQLCCSLDMQQGNLATRHAFLPMVHEVVYYLARQTGEILSLDPGEGLSLRLTSFGAGLHSSGGGGLAATYYRGSNFEHEALKRIDRNVDFNWGAGGPGPGVPVDWFSARWTGSIVPEESGSYTISAAADDRISVWIDGDNMLGAGGKASVELDAGARYDLRVEYREENGGAYVRLLWARGSENAEPIPARCLSPLRGNSFFSTIGGMTAVGPEGQKRTAVLTAGKEGLVLKVEGDVIPGIYRVAGPEDLTPILGGLLDSEGDLPFSVLRDVRESRLLPLDETDIAFVRRYADVVEAESIDHVRQALEGKSFGEEIWKQLALAAFALLLVEILLTRWIASHRGTGMTADVEFEERTGPSASFRQQLEQVRNATNRRAGV